MAIKLEKSNSQMKIDDDFLPPNAQNGDYISGNKNRPGGFVGSYDKSSGVLSFIIEGQVYCYEEAAKKAMLDGWEPIGRNSEGLYIMFKRSDSYVGGIQNPFTESLQNSKLDLDYTVSPPISWRQCFVSRFRTIGERLMNIVTGAYS